MRSLHCILRRRSYAMRPGIVHFIKVCCVDRRCADWIESSFVRLIRCDVDGGLALVEYLLLQTSVAICATDVLIRTEHIDERFVDEFWIGKDIALHLGQQHRLIQVCISEASFVCIVLVRSDKISYTLLLLLNMGAGHRPFNASCLLHCAKLVHGV